MRSTNRKALIATIILTGVACLVEIVVAQCPVDWSLTASKSKMYLFYPTAADATFPEYYTAEVETAPLDPFNVSDLAAGIGTTGQLRDRITNIVKEDYCEFDVEIVPTTTVPAPTEARWQVVGVATDDEQDGGSDLFGVAQDVDLNNADPQDYSRVFARSFRNAYGGAGDALNGGNSTLERWATAIGHTTSHEAAHNYGLSHTDSAARPGEDEQNWHIMATGGTGLTGEQRASRNRHFGDREYELLGHNIGLRIKTLYNWDFINPNAESASQLVLTLLSPATTLTRNWFWSGGSSPWTNPTVAAAGTQSFQGTTYNKFTLTFSAPKTWDGGAAGVVPGGTEFHVGATFAESAMVLVYETRLKNAGGTNLNLHPRLVGFNAGVADTATGDFNIRAFNPDPAHQLIIEDLRVAHLPRLASIGSMVGGAHLQDVRGNPITASEPSRYFTQQKSFEVRENVDFRLATLNDPRSVDHFYDNANCKKGFKPGGQTPGGTPTGPGDSKTGEIEYCPRGWALSLFPATYVYLTATVVEPNAKFWDKIQAKYVNGPLRTKVFYQFSGIVPDLNNNGVDDLIDVRTSVSFDANKNGIVDEVEGKKTPENVGHRFMWWWWILLCLALIILIWLFLKRKKSASV
jgi:hypothetical protein